MLEQHRNGTESNGRALRDLDQLFGSTVLRASGVELSDRLVDSIDQLSGDPNRFDIPDNIFLGQE